MKTSLTAKGVTWTNIEEPSNDELAAIVREVGLSPVDAEFIVRGDLRPEITVRENYILILMYVPVFHKKLRVTSGTALHFLVTSAQLHTLQYEPIVSLQKIIKDFSENPEKQEEYFNDDALSLALYILSQIHNSSFRKIGRLAKHIEIVEDAVFQGNERKMVEEVAILSRDVLDFQKIIRPQVPLFAAMPDQPFDEHIKTQWKRISGQISQMWELLQSLHDSSKELRSTNDSLLQHKENELLRMLSLYSIITIPIWIFVSPYIPRGADTGVGDVIIFWGVLLFLILFLLAIFVRAKRRKVI